MSFGIRFRDFVTGPIIGIDGDAAKRVLRAYQTVIPVIAVLINTVVIIL